MTGAYFRNIVSIQGSASRMGKKFIILLKGTEKEAREKKKERLAVRCAGLGGKDGGARGLNWCGAKRGKTGLRWEGEQIAGHSSQSTTRHGLFVLGAMWANKGELCLSCIKQAKRSSSYHKRVCRNRIFRPASRLQNIIPSRGLSREGLLVN